MASLLRNIDHCVHNCVWPMVWYRVDHDSFTHWSKILISCTYRVDPDAVNDNETNCLKLQHMYAEHHTEFQRCAIQNSEPVIYCHKCFNHFINETTAFRNFTGNDTCRQIYVDSDRLNIIETTHANSRNLWNAGSCSGMAFTSSTHYSIIIFTNQKFSSCRMLQLWDQRVGCQLHAIEHDGGIFPSHQVVGELHEELHTIGVHWMQGSLWAYQLYVQWHEE